MRFIHTADIHLDSPLRGLSAYPEAPAERLRGATREAFVKLVDFAIEERVDFIVIAGDVYDGDWRDFNTGLFFVRQMGRLRQAGIPVYLLHGNHDAESEMTRRLELPDNVHVFAASKPSTFRIDALKVALHGRSFKVAATTENLAASYPLPVPGWLNIGVLHTAMTGNPPHDPYAPCSLAELQARGYQYWALGHVHERRIWRDSAVTVAYPGNLQGRHIRETGAKGALLVTASEEAGEITAVEPVELDVLRWHLLDVDVSAAADLPAVVRLLGRAMAQLLAAQAGGQALALRIQLQGRSAAHGALVASAQQLRQEVLAQAIGLDAERLWVERVKVLTHPLLEAGEAAAAAAGDAVNEGADALAGLAAQAASDPDFLAALQADLQTLLDSVKHEVLQASPELAAIRAGDLAALMDDTVPALLARVESRDPRQEASR